MKITANISDRLSIIELGFRQYTATMTNVIRLSNERNIGVISHLYYYSYLYDVPVNQEYFKHLLELVYYLYEDNPAIDSNSNNCLYNVFEFLFGFKEITSHMNILYDSDKWETLVDEYDIYLCNL